MNKISKNLLKVFAVAGLIFPTLTSCDDNIIYDNLEPCNIGVRLRFVYDYNMEYANAFPSQVDCINVFFYDENGNFVTAREVTGEVLADENYRMIVDLEPGNYDIVVYGGTNSAHTSFTFADFPGQESTFTDRNISLKDEMVGEELHPLFYGTVDFTCDEWDLDYRDKTVYLMRDTNSIRVHLQQVDGEPMFEDMFDFNILADNTHFQYDNKVVLQGAQTIFNPWFRNNQNPGFNPDGSQLWVCQAEFSVPRLVWDKNELVGLTRANVADGYEGQPWLKINYKADNRNVVDIPLLPYLLMCKPEHSNSVQSPNITDQEFLDRENRYDLFFFLDKHYNWIYVEIRVLDWVVRVNNVQM